MHNSKYNQSVMQNYYIIYILSKLCLIFESISNLILDWYYDDNVLLMKITFITFETRDSNLVGIRFILLQTAICY